MKLVSFWNLLRDEKVQIPMFQRDYAQGRQDKEPLRRKFISRLLEALRAPAKKPVKLDFVFGVKDGFSSFLPLDGQQRLTTLWLLHWYIAQRAEKVDEASSVLAKFSYETRGSSKAFCRDLSMVKGWDGKDVKTFIARQRWYYDRYDMDPSIRGFVRSLVTIEKSVSESDDFPGFWKVLTSGDEMCPIRFFLRDDLHESVADDLYIKMNSRGKGLTEFENFKADLFGVEIQGGCQQRLFSVQDAALVDNAWTNLFWVHQKNKEIDDIYFQFFKRFLLSWRIAETGDGGRLTTMDIDPVLNEELYKHLHEGKEYTGIAIYEPTLVPDMLDDLKAFFEAYADLKKIISEYEIDHIVAPYWLKQGEPMPYTLIPRYGMCGDIKVVLDSKIEKGLPVLYAASRFLIKNKQRIKEVGMLKESARATAVSNLTDRLKTWMRFVWNIIDTTFINNDVSMVSAIRFMRVLSDEHTWDIEAYLASLKPEEIGTVFAKKAYVTEVQKARLRAYERQRREDNVDVFAWKDEIARAEESAFLHGEIGFLLESNVVESYLHGDDASVFSKQVDKANEYWDDSGVKAAVAVAFGKAMIKGLDRFCPHGSRGFLNNEFLCRNGKGDLRDVVLFDSTMGSAVAYILAQTSLDEVKIRPFVDLTQDSDRKGAEKLREALLNSGVLNQPKVFGSGDQGCWWLHAYATVAFYRKGKSSSKRYYLDTSPMSWIQGCRRNEFLFGGAGVQVIPEDRVDGLNVCVPNDKWTTRFTYQGRKYCWGQDNYVWLLNENGELVKGHNFWFEYNLNWSRDEFLQKLSDLITQD